MTKNIFIFLFLATFCLKSQNDKSGDIKCKVSDNAQFPGGQKSLKEFIKTNLKWPGPEWCGQGSVYLKLKVDSVGNLNNITIVKGIDSLANKEALRLVSIMPKWMPGKCDGKPIDSWVTLPIKFKMQ